MDKSLDEIIKERPRANRRRSAGKTSRAQVLGTAGVAPRARAAVKAGTKTVVTAPAAPQTTSDKIIVSNLPQDVNEQQVKELFHATVGPLREVTLHYDAHGRSKGVASVHFQRKGDGQKAYGQYNNRLIDGKRPMKIEIVMDPTKVPAPSLASRVAPAAQPTATQAAPSRGGPRKRGGRRGGRRGGNERPAKSAADLDAEMEDYTSNTATAAPTTAPAA